MYLNMVRIAVLVRQKTRRVRVQSPSLIIRGRAILLGSSSFYHKQETTTRLNGLSGVPSVRRRRLLHNFTIRYQGSCTSYWLWRYCLYASVRVLYVYVQETCTFFYPSVNNNRHELDFYHVWNFR